jgi:hypothetical protein
MPVYMANTAACSCKDLACTNVIAVANAAVAAVVVLQGVRALGHICT